MALHEPMKPGDFDPTAGAGAALARIQDFACATRIQVQQEGKALSQQKDGAVPENPVAIAAAASGLRPMDVSLGLIDVSARALSTDFTLIIKHNALFTALLPDLAASFPMYAIVRNPLAVLASWNLVDLPINKGHIPAAEQFDSGLKAQLAATPDVLERQLIILEWFCARYLQHLNGRWLRYEDFVKGPLTLVNALGLPAPVKQVPVRDSKNTVYDHELMERLYTRLSGFGEAIWAIYPRSQVDELMDNIRASR